MSELVSIIVPAYNVEKYIARSLDSVINQTYANLEIVVVDDGSTDRTGAIVDEYAQKDSRIVAIHTANCGVAAARNTGLDNCSGEFIGWVDSDDWADEHMVEFMVESMIENSSPLAICTYQTVSEKDSQETYNSVVQTLGDQPTRNQLSEDRALGDQPPRNQLSEDRALGNQQPSNRTSDNQTSRNQTDKYYASDKLYLLSQAEAFETYICDDKSFHIYNSVWSKIARRKLYEGLRFPEGHESEEILLTAQMLSKCESCVFVDIPLYNYVVDRGSSIMNSKERLFDRRFEDELPLWYKQIDYLYTVNQKWGDLASYHLYRRELFYYLDFRRMKMKDAASKLAYMIKCEKEKVEAVYKNSFVSTGDRLRMKMFLKSPQVYGIIVEMYEKIVIPIRNINAK